MSEHEAKLKQHKVFSKEAFPHFPDSPVSPEIVDEFLQSRGWLRQSHQRNGSSFQLLVTTVDADICPGKSELRKVADPERRAATVRRDENGIVMLIKGEHLTDADLAAIDDVEHMIERMRFFREYA